MKLLAMATRRPALVSAQGGSLADAAAGLLAASVLTAFPHTAVLEPTIEDRHDAHPATVRRAVAFIETHPDLDLSVVDIARA